MPSRYIESPDRIYCMLRSGDTCSRSAMRRELLDAMPENNSIRDLQPPCTKHRVRESRTPVVMMPSVKRQASDSFSGPNQLLVKRQKSNSDLRQDGALAVTAQGKGKDGTLVQSVSAQHSTVSLRSTKHLWIRSTDMALCNSYLEQAAYKPRLWS
jgi:hypothetical protein